ncbi:hypothetical protein NC652_026793 [Populus alba x Populus x berolinensis]|nr:hypothetical protein NC652_026793 [Populus alba x Populus x berolinensis]
MECLKGDPFLIYMVGSLENLGKKQDNETFLGSICLGFKMKKRKRKRKKGYLESKLVSETHPDQRDFRSSEDY